MTDENVTFSVDIQKAYPEESRVKYYNRTYRMKRGKDADEKAYIEITDTYAFEKAINTLSFNYIIWKKPVIVNNGTAGNGLIKVDIDAKTSFYMEFDKENTEVDIEHCDISDERLRQTWGDEGIYRIILTRTVPEEGSFSVRIYTDYM
jgi:hypothetical protein